MDCPKCGKQIDDKDYIYCPYCSKPLQTRKRWEDFTKKIKLPFKKLAIHFLLAITIIANMIPSPVPPQPNPPAMVYEMRYQEEQDQNVQVNLEIETQDASLFAPISGDGENIRICEGVYVHVEEPNALETIHTCNLIFSIEKKIDSAIGPITEFLTELLEKRMNKMAKIKDGPKIEVTISNKEEFEQLILERYNLNLISIETAGKNEKKHSDQQKQTDINYQKDPL